MSRFGHFLSAILQTVFVRSFGLEEAARRLCAAHATVLRNDEKAIALNRFSVFVHLMYGSIRSVELTFALYPLTGYVIALLWLRDVKEALIAIPFFFLVGLIAGLMTAVIEIFLGLVALTGRPSEPLLAYLLGGCAGVAAALAIWFSFLRDLFLVFSSDGGIRILLALLPLIGVFFVWRTLYNIRTLPFPPPVLKLIGYDASQPSAPSDLISPGALSGTVVYLYRPSTLSLVLVPLFFLPVSCLLGYFALTEPGPKKFIFGLVVMCVCITVVPVWIAHLRFRLRQREGTIVIGKSEITLPQRVRWIATQPCTIRFADIRQIRFKATPLGFDNILITHRGGRMILQSFCLEERELAAILYQEILERWENVAHYATE